MHACQPLAAAQPHLVYVLLWDAPALIADAHSEVAGTAAHTGLDRWHAATGAVGGSPVTFNNCSTVPICNLTWTHVSINTIFGQEST